MEAHDIILVLSCLGVINGLILASYFLYAAYPDKKHNRYLALLLFVLCLRIGKSIIYYFNVENPFLPFYIEIGLSACALIGPCLYFFVQHYVHEYPKLYPNLQLVGFATVIIAVSTMYPYFDHIRLWQKIIIPIIYVQWFIYIAMSFIVILKSRYYKEQTKTRGIDRKLWLLSIWGGVLLVWISYNTVYFLTYILGAVTFSFVVYLIILLLLMGFRRSTILNPQQNNPLNATDDTFITTLQATLNQMYAQSNLTIDQVAMAMNIPKHQLSQVLNQTYKMSFPRFLKSFRIEKVKEQLQMNNAYTLEAIGQECGFKAKSTFYTAFKQETGMTPRQYRANLYAQTGSDLQN